jgi:hypothetical protein
MASLSGTSINSTYQGLLKTDGNTALPSGFTTATITDGAGNATGLKIGQDYIVIEPLNGGHIYDIGSENGFTFGPSGLTASGSWDFTSATVTGLPDNNTTYDLDSIQTGSNVALTLVGSDASLDTITLVAGTNITLTDDGSNNITIDAAGGGGGGLTGLSTTTATTHYGPDTADVNFVSFLIPANTFTAGDIIQIKVLNTCNFNTGWIYQALWISNSSADLSGYQIGGAASTNNESKFYAKTAFITVADGTGLATAFHGADQDSTDQANNGIAFFDDRAVTPIDWTSDVYVNLSCYVDDAASFITNRGINVVKINA